MIRFTFAALLLAGAIGLPAPASAQLRVGLNLPVTGVASSLGIPMQKTVPLLPTTIGGQTVTYITLDSGTDATRSAANTRKLVTEDKVDVLIGEATSPASLAMIDIAAESHTPLISLAAATILVQPVDDKRRWVFKVVPNDDVGAVTAMRYMAAHGIKRVGFVGLNDSYGQSWVQLLTDLAPKFGLELVDTEYYARTDTSTTAQALKLVAAKPDAVLIGAGGTPALVPTRDLRQRGFKGVIYQTHGISSQELITQGGKAIDGSVFAGEPFPVRDDLPADNPHRKLADDFVERYKAMYGVEPAQFGANLVDAIELLKVTVPAALKAGRPGTAEFRAALRDGLETVKDVPLNNGLLTNTPQDHAGFKPEASYMVRIENGAFHLVQ